MQSLQQFLNMHLYTHTVIPFCPLQFADELRFIVMTNIRKAWLVPAGGATAADRMTEAASMVTQRVILVLSAAAG